MQRLLFIFSVVFVMGCGASAEQPLTGGEVSSADAQRIYVMKCSLCHGDQGNLMVAGAPDLTTSRMSLDDRIAYITYGKGTMPPQKGILTADEIKAVALYIESFRK
jgi:mono/diheme cytochrome c family protein